MNELTGLLVPLATAVMLLIITALLSRGLGLRIEGSILIAGARGIIQLLILASVLLILFDYPLRFSFLALVIMVVLAGYTSHKHAENTEQTFKNSIVSIAIPAFLLITLLFSLEIFPVETRFMIPIGSIMIGNSMNTCSLAIDRHLGEIKNRRSEIEAYLILGATPTVAIRSCLKQSLRSSLIPIMDNMKNLGLIWIPGIMTGMLITGENPYLAASTQIILFVTILLSGVMSASLLLHLTTKSIFNTACQLKEIQ